MMDVLSFLRAGRVLAMSLVLSLALGACAEAKTQDPEGDVVVGPQRIEGPSRKSVSLGGARLKSSQHQLEVSIGGPVTRHTTKSQQHQLEIGIGVFLSPQSRTPTNVTEPEQP